MEKKGEKSEKKIHKVKKNFADLSHRLAKVCEGLVYISEIDSPVTVYEGTSVSELSSSNFAAQLDAGDAPIGEAGFSTLFARLTAKKDWHGERERSRAKKFLDLQKLIEENLRDPKVFRIGRIQIRIYAVGLDPDGRILGITMRAVET